MGPVLDATLQELFAYDKKQQTIFFADTRWKPFFLYKNTFGVEISEQILRSEEVQL